jgi:hypothetical protein
MDVALGDLSALSLLEIIVLIGGLSLLPRPFLP